MSNSVHRRCGALLFVLLLGACHPKDGKEATPSNFNERNWIHGIGYVEPSGEIRRLAFKHPGIIGEMLVEVGQRVKEGDVLTRMRDEEESAAIREAETTLASARAEFAQVEAGINPARIAAQTAAKALAEAEAEFARRELARQESLFQSKLIPVTEHDLFATNVQRRDAALRQAEADLTHLQKFVRAEDRAVAEAKVQEAEAKLAKARATWAETQLRAPSDGAVLEILHRAGESAHSAAPEPILIFADASRLRVRAEIDESYALELHPGMTARVFGRGLGRSEISGTIALVKSLMGKKTVFANSATERKDLDVVQVLIDLPEGTTLPIGLEVDVKLSDEPGRPPPRLAPRLRYGYGPSSRIE